MHRRSHKNYLAARSSVDDFFLIGRTNDTRYKIGGMGFDPQFSDDGRYLVHGYSMGEASDKLTVVDLSKPELPRVEVTCLCSLVGFLDQARFLTLEEGKVVHIRKLDTGEVISQLFVFPQEVSEARYFGAEGLLVGLGADDRAILAKPTQVDNSVNFGGLTKGDALHSVAWLSNDVILLDVWSLESSKRKTVILMRRRDGGFEKFWSWNLDQEKMPDDEWSGPVARVLNVEDTTPNSDVTGSSSQTPGEPYDVAVAGTPDVVARRIDGRIGFVERETGDILFLLPQLPSKSTSLWVSPEKNMFAAGSQDGVIRLWSVAAGRDPLLTLRAHNAAIEQLDSNEDQTAFVTAEWRGSVRVWQLLTPKQLVSAAQAKR